MEEPTRYNPRPGSYFYVFPVKWDAALPPFSDLVPSKACPQIFRPTPCWTRSPTAIIFVSECNWERFIFQFTAAKKPNLHTKKSRSIIPEKPFKLIIISFQLNPLHWERAITSKRREALSRACR